jgi:hypothetical protein
MDFILIPLALIGLVGVADVAFFKGVIGVRLAVLFKRG